MLVNRIWNGCRLNKRCELVPHCAKRDGNFWRMEGLPFVGSSRFLPGSRVISGAGFEILSRSMRLSAQRCVLVRGRSSYQRRTREDLKRNQPRRFLLWSAERFARGERV